MANEYWQRVSTLRYVFENRLKLKTMLYDKTPSVFDHNVAASDCVFNPVMGKSLIDSHFRTNEDKIKEFIKIVTSSSYIIIESGKRNSGKTMFNIWLADILFKEGYRIYYVNPDFKLPSFMKEITYNPVYPYLEVISDFYPEIIRIKNYSDILNYLRKNSSKLGKVFIFHDECHKDLPKNVSTKEGDTLRTFWAELRKIFLRLSVVYTSQTLSGIPIQLFNYADMQIYKPFNFWQLSMDRKQIVESFAKFVPDKVNEVLIVYDNYLFFENPMPDMSK